MEFIQPTAEQAHAGLRALLTIVKATDGILHDTERNTLLAAQHYLIKHHFPIDEQQDITAEELAEIFVDEKLSKQLCNAFTVLVMASGNVDKDRLKQAKIYAKALKVDNNFLGVLQKRMRGHMVLMRLDFMRRSYVKERIAEAWRKGGLGNMIRTLRAVAGFGKIEPAITKKYLALKDYPEGSLGRTYYQHLRENDFPLPGEENGAPEALVVHDLNHILGDYNTDPLSEIDVLFFQAGHSNFEPFSFMVFILLQMNLGADMVAFSSAETGIFQPDRAFAAFKRGLLVNRDIFSGWDYKNDLKKQVSDLRKGFNIVDKTSME